ncbi:MAG: hypothetical protein KBF80_02920 [Flavobacteriales bacterium]|nr:hypothetical protein [Flavobacteriales bacterium]
MSQKHVRDRFNRKQQLAAEGHAELLDFMHGSFAPVIASIPLLRHAKKHGIEPLCTPGHLRRSDLVRWGLLEKVVTDDALDPYDGYRPTEEGSRYLLYEEAFQLLAIRSGFAKELMDRREAEVQRESSECFEQLDPGEKTAAIFAMREFIGLHQFNPDKQWGNAWTLRDHEGHDLVLPIELVRRKTAREESLSFIGGIEELFSNPDEVRVVEQPGGLRTHRYIKIYPGLVLFGIVAIEGDRPVRIVDWFGFTYDPSSADYTAQKEIIRRDWIGECIHVGPEHPSKQAKKE